MNLAPATRDIPAWLDAAWMPRFDITDLVVGVTQKYMLRQLVFERREWLHMRIRDTGGWFVS